MTRARALPPAGVWISVYQRRYWISRSSAGRLVVFGGECLENYPEEMQAMAIEAAEKAKI